MNKYINGHARRKLSKEELIIKKAAKKLCRCNCGEFTDWSDIRKKYNKYVNGHNRKKLISRKREFNIPDKKEVQAQTIANWWYSVYVKEQKKYRVQVPDLTQYRNKRTRTIFLKVVDKLRELKLNPSSKHDVEQYLFAIAEYTTIKKRICYPTILYDKNSGAKWESFLKDYTSIHTVGQKNKNAPAWFSDDAEIRDRVFLSMGVIAKIVCKVKATTGFNCSNSRNATVLLKSSYANQLFNPGMDYGYLLLNPITKIMLREPRYKKYFDYFMINNLKVLRMAYRQAEKEDVRYLEKIKLFRREIKNGLKNKDADIQLEYKKKGIGKKLLVYL